MKKFAHWVFDLDGTVIDSSPAYKLSIQKILETFEVKPTPDLIQRAFHFFDPNEYFATMFDDPIRVTRAVQMLVDLNHQYAEKVPVFAGIEDLLKMLRSNKVRMSVWTGRDLSSTTKILKVTGLFDYFEFCVSRSCVERNKPFPDGLLKILDEAKHSSDEVVMIGDHEYDMRGAIAASVTGVSVSWEGLAHPIASTLSHRHFNKIEDLTNWAQELY